MRPKLSAFEEAWFDATADAIFPEHGRLPHGIARMHPARFFQSVLDGVPLEQALGLRLTLWLVALSPLFAIRKLGSITSLAAPDRVHVLDSLLASRFYVVRQLTMSLKAIITLLYVQSPDVRRAMTTPLHVPAEESGSSLISGTRLVAGRRAEQAKNVAA